MMRIDNLLHIPAEVFTDQLKKKLTIENTLYSKNVRLGLPVKGMEKKFILYTYEEDSNTYAVPKFCLGNFSNFSETVVKQHVNAPIEINFKPKFPFTFNSSQVETIKSSIKMLVKESASIVVANPGEGKTLMAIKQICLLKQKTLILCHKDSLMKQWREELLKLTDLKPNEIGILQQGKFKDGKVVIGSQASLMSDTFGEEINNLFGLKVQDEVHRIGARMFLNAYTRFNTMYSIGLSATPNRSDDMQQLYFMHASDNIIKHNNVRSLNASYIVLKYQRKMKWKKYPSFIPFGVQVTNNLMADTDRLERFVTIIKKLLKSKRKILVVGSRIAMLSQLMERISKEEDVVCKRFFGTETKKIKKKVAVFSSNIKIGVPYRFRYDDDTKVGIVKFIKKFQGNTKAEIEFDGKTVVLDAGKILVNDPFYAFVSRVWKKTTVSLESEDAVPMAELSELHSADVIFAVLEKFKDALNIPHLDTLVAVTPYSDETTFVQLKGRIERKVEGKKTPIIIDFVDVAINLTEGMFKKRLSLYDKYQMKEIK